MHCILYLGGRESLRYIADWLFATTSTDWIVPFLKQSHVFKVTTLVLWIQENVNIVSGLTSINRMHAIRWFKRLAVNMSTLHFASHLQLFRTKSEVHFIRRWHQTRRTSHASFHVAFHHSLRIVWAACVNRASAAKKRKTVIKMKFNLQNVYTGTHTEH